MKTKILTTVFVFYCCVFHMIAQEPTAQIIKINEIEASSFRVLASVHGKKLKERGIAYSLHPGLSRAEVFIPFGNGNFGSFSCGVHDLQPKTTYYVKAYALITGDVVIYSTEKMVTTSDLLAPAVRTLSVNEIQQTSARVQGSVIGSEIARSGVFYSEDPKSLKSGKFMSSGSHGFGSFSVKLNHLKPATRYYVVFMAANDSGESFGETLSFQTQEHKD